MLKKEGNNMTIERTINGYIKVSDIVDNYYVSRLYMGYSKSTAKRLFLSEIKAKG